MSRTVSLIFFAVVLVMSQAVTFSQSKPTAATYITDEEVKAVNATPGIDRTIRVVDIGNENFAVGIIHRGASGAARGTGAGAGAGAGRGAGNAAGGGAGRGAGGGGGRGNATPCGEAATPPPAGGTPGGIAHDS